MPFWNSYKAKDGYVVVVALTDRQWNNLMEVIGRTELIGDPRFDNFVARIKNADEGLTVVTQWMESRTRDEIINALSAKKDSMRQGAKLRRYQQRSPIGRKANVSNRFPCTIGRN